MVSRWIVTNITSARGTLHYSKTRTHSLRGSTRDLWTVIPPPLTTENDDRSDEKSIFAVNIPPAVPSGRAV
jgi:hypothetical protein